MSTTHNPALVLRVAGAGEADLVRRLAELDDAPPLDEPVLLALIEDAPVAAVSLRDGRAVADPFVPASDALELLRLRAAHLSAARPRRRRLRIVRPLRPRLA